MKAQIVRIGNSRGIRLSKSILEETGFREVVELQIVSGGLLLRPGRKTREGWAEAAREMAERGDDTPLLSDDTGRTRFDRDEWRW
ncbi:MAG TPA: AbrB/MazE/SpoVT family DNA-binding domain-containing protein [Thermoanaerobaculia bacterium]|nr:AbrB/MazE/SpoVT family DNA-binding domain-containing protein [Thermoanaerobaculia bacterium]